MKSWKVINVFGDNNDLASKLNILEKRDSTKVKHILFVEKNNYQIVYTEEDVYDYDDCEEDVYGR